MVESKSLIESNNLVESKNLNPKNLKESNVLKETMLVGSKAGLTLFRNNTGTAWQGDYSRTHSGSVLLRNPRVVHFGLCVGSSDLIGWRQVVITPDMVGQKIAQFIGLETKYGRRTATEAQDNFLNQLDNAGGLAMLVRDASEVLQKINKEPPK